MKHFLIGIAGASGSGKSSLSKMLAKEYRTCSIDLDNYFINKKKIPFLGKWRNAELPENIKFRLLYKHLKKIKSGKNIKSPIYSWEKGKIIKYKIIKPKLYIFIEGNYLFHKKEIRKLINLKIFLQTSEKTLLKRRTKRTGKWAIEYYKKIVYPYYKKFALPTKKYADKIILVNKPLNKIKKEIIEFIQKNEKSFQNPKKED